MTELAVGDTVTLTIDKYGTRIDGKVSAVSPWQFVIEPGLHFEREATTRDWAHVYSTGWEEYDFAAITINSIGRINHTKDNL